MMCSINTLIYVTIFTLYDYILESLPRLNSLTLIRSRKQKSLFIYGSGNQMRLSVLPNHTSEGSILKKDPKKGTV